MSVVETKESIPLDLIASSGTKYTIKSAKYEHDIETSRGPVQNALIIELQVEGDKGVYSKLWSLDKQTVSGSVGRILSKAGIKHRDELEKGGTKKLVGLQGTVRKTGDKTYWS